MLSKQTSSLVCDFLTIFARSEKKLEVTRQLLAQENEFEPYAAFKRLDRNINQILTCQDISLLLQDNGQNYSLEAIHKSYISHYDIDMDKGLVFSEFLRSILPFDNPNLRSICTQRPTYDVAKNQRLHPDVECIMARLIENEVCAYLELEPLKQNLANQVDFSIEKCFADIAGDSNTDFLDFENLMTYFSINNYYPYEEEIISILRRLDKNDDGRLSLEDLAFGILPKFFQPSDIQKASFVPIEKKLTSQSNKFATPSKQGLAGSIMSSGSKLQVLSPAKNKYPFEPVRKISPVKNINETVDFNRFLNIIFYFGIRASPKEDYYYQFKQNSAQRIANLDALMNKSQQKQAPGTIYSPSRQIASPISKYNQNYY